MNDALLNLYEPATLSATGNGTAKRLGRNRSFRAIARVGGDVTGTNPSATGAIAQSQDQSTWTVLATFPAIIDEMIGYVDASPPSAAEAPRPEVPGEDPLIVTFNTTQDYVRVQWTVTGTTPVFPLTSVVIQPLPSAHRLSGV